MARRGQVGGVAKAEAVAGASAGASVGASAGASAGAAPVAPPALEIVGGGAFGLGEATDAALSEGAQNLAAPEPGFRWTLGKESGFTLRLAPLAGAAGGSVLFLELEVAPFLALPALMQQVLRVFVNGVRLGEMSLRGAARLSFALPDGLAQGGVLRVGLQHPSAASPKDVGVGEDPRVLGICLQRAAVLRGARAHYAEPAFAPRERPALPGVERDPAVLAAAVREVTGLDAAGVLGRFESLGVSGEFAAVQAAAGVAADGLLARGGFSPAQLLAGLDQGFAAAADGGALVFYRAEAGGAPMALHTGLGLSFAAPGGISRAARVAALSRDLAARRTRLLGDLCGGRRIFVYHQAGRVEAAEIASLRLLMRSYGDAALLVVVPGPRVRDGVVQAIGRGVYLGSIDYLTPAGRALGEISHGLWLGLCANALVMAREDGVLVEG